MLVSVIILLVALYLFVSIISSCHVKQREEFMGKNQDYIEEYPYIDDQKMWYAELPSSNFKKTLSSKNFIIKKKEGDDKTLTLYVEDWLNGIKELQKPKSKISIMSLNKMNENNLQYEMVIHRNGRNHGKVMTLMIKEEPEQINVNNIKILGVKNQYEISNGALFNDVGNIELHYEFGDMWTTKEDEILIKDSIERVSVHDL